MNRAAACVATVATAFSLAGCAVEKTSNPLSPSVAGPIAGVNVTSPTPAVPIAGARIAVDQQPITLTVTNASTSGVRPLSYVFEVAADAGFTTVLVSKTGVTPGASGKTSLTLTDPLPTGKTYYWHSRAEDGANTGPFSSPMTFSVYTPIVIQAPVLVSPVAVQKVPSLRPKLTWNNAARSGPVGAIQYVIELSDTVTFARKIAIWTVNETQDQTSVTPPDNLSYSTIYFWHVQAFDPTTVGPFSTTESFTTLDAPVVVVAPSGGGGGGTGSAGCAPTAADGINMSQAGIYNSPLDLASWCVGAKITSVQFTSGAFLVDFNRRDGANRWPDSPFGDGGGGTIEYTLGMCLNINGAWDCSAVVQFWYGRDLSASAPPSQIATAWFYDGRWGPLTGHQPADGEQVGLFVCAGNCRNTTVGIYSVLHERSNIVMVPWSNGGGPSYTF